MQANPCHVKTLFLLKFVDVGDSVEREKDREREPEGVYRVFYSQEPRGGSGVKTYWEGWRDTCKEGFCCFRPYMRAGKPIFYTFSHILPALLQNGGENRVK